MSTEVLQKWRSQNFRICGREDLPRTWILQVDELFVGFWDLTLNWNSLNTIDVCFISIANGLLHAFYDWFTAKKKRKSRRNSCKKSITPIVVFERQVVSLYFSMLKSIKFIPEMVAQIECHQQAFCFKSPSKHTKGSIQERYRSWMWTMTCVDDVLNWTSPQKKLPILRTILYTFAV